MNTSTISLILAATLAIASVSPALAQSTLGGAKNQQNKIGGAAKPAPVVGGAVIHTPTPPIPPKPGPVANTVKPTSPGMVTPSTTGNAALNQRSNPPVTTPKPTGAVVTSNLKCANGACTSKGPKP
jgi:hypothetical protein